MRKPSSLLIIVLAFVCFNVQGQPPVSVRDSLYSEILKEKRIFSVIGPEGYVPGSPVKFDVVYAIDGEGNTGMISQIEGFLRESGFMPQTIIVGIHNTQRNRDLTPTVAGNASINGGAPAFLSFMEKELIPYINKKYPVKGSNILFGHSLGGLFAMYALLTKPALFDSYIAADPSFWWDNEYMIHFTAEKLNPAIHANKSLWIAGRGGQESRQMGIPGIDSVLKSKAIPGFNWKVTEYPGETHNSIKFKTVYDGLKFIYTGFNSRIEFHPQNGMVIKGKPLRVWFFESSTVPMRYTTDGTEPTGSSSKIVPEIMLNGPASMRIKSFTARGAFDRLVRAEFTEAKMMRPLSMPANAKPGGFHYSYYEGTWDSLPDFSKLKPVRSGIADKNFAFNTLPRKNNFACLYEGYLEILQDGYYVFGLTSDDGSKLFIGNQLVIDSDGLHGPEDRSYALPLEKGFYPLRLEYFQRDGGLDLRFIYVTPDAKAPTPVQVPFERMYSAALSQ